MLCYAMLSSIFTSSSRENLKLSFDGRERGKSKVVRRREETAKQVTGTLPCLETL